MYVYVWKDSNGTPFYVGLSKSMRRTDPVASTGRGWLCKQTLAKIGPSNVRVELYPVGTLEAGKALEQQLILQYGRIQTSTGPLTNLRSGGEGTATMSAQGRLALSARMKTDNPMHRADVYKKAVAQMRSTHARQKYTGDKNPAKRPEVRAKIRAKWQDPEYRAARIKERTGRAIHSEEERARRRAKIAALPSTHVLRTSHITLNTDQTIRKKRITALQRHEVRAKISAALKRSWAARKQNR